MLKCHGIPLAGPWKPRQITIQSVTDCKRQIAQKKGLAVTPQDLFGFNENYQGEPLPSSRVDSPFKSPVSLLNRPGRVFTPRSRRRHLQDLYNDKDLPRIRVDKQNGSPSLRGTLVFDNKCGSLCQHNSESSSGCLPLSYEKK